MEDGERKREGVRVEMRKAGNGTNLIIGKVWQRGNGREREEGRG